jgi:hypothetical protein
MMYQQMYGAGGALDIPDCGFDDEDEDGKKIEEESAQKLQSPS